MREILFRGKTVATESEWVEGFYNHIPCGRFHCDEHCIQTIDEDARIGQLYTVYDSTVGQFTGLTDKNGKKIFEGDIIKWDELEWGSEHTEAVEWDYSLLAMREDDWNEWCEVIGNIHDNPELLEVDK